MKTLNFSYNWNNKLYCDAFTTIRPYDKNKFNIGDEYEILLKGKHVKHAKIIDIKTFNLHQLNNFMAYLDTGHNAKETIDIIINIYKDKLKNEIENTTFAYILFKTIKNK